MLVLSTEKLRKLGTAFLVAAGAPEDEAGLVSNFLVRANLAGHDSHGIIRILRYVDNVLQKRIKPGAKLEVVRETSSSALLNGNWGFDQVVESKAMEFAIEKFNRIHGYSKPETRIIHTISTLRKIMTYPLIYNTEIPQILQSERQRRKEEPYKILQNLETKLRECIQTQLEKVTKNWWKERVPKDVQEKAELRKNKNEKQWPWHTSKDLPLIFTLTSPTTSR